MGPWGLPSTCPTLAKNLRLTEPSLFPAENRIGLKHASIEQDLVSRRQGSGLWAQLKGGKHQHQALGSGEGEQRSGSEGEQRERRRSFRAFLFASSAPSLLYLRDIHYPVL